MITGVINLLKPPGMTSHDAVSYVRKTYSQKQVGHAGTLDPAAAGVLPIFLGKATRLAEYFTNAEKQYRAELLFGLETDSGDDTGNVTRRANTIPEPDTVRQVLQTFLGSSLQVPPMHSAIKINGQKLYDLARQGITVERKARSITINSISLLRMDGSIALFDVSCSKGTYIRSLCSDIGICSGSAAVMTFLVRTRVGKFCLHDAVSLEEIARNPQEVLKAADSFLDALPAVHLSVAESEKFLTGQRQCLQDTKETLVKVYRIDNSFIGIGNLTNGLLIPEKVFLPNSEKID